ncbi:cell envelope biogenesis protein TolA [Bradyrhizobium sp. G127]|uniref:cell envelope biogenesis protein TolA n=1 Tax=Bradyrhizobium sp. G127 TaxID=2904800 RepID=UPI001F458B9A|nr:cell envelope biogenesis protein TolA [Bradyrhizobium sp. G127]MCF2522096.1 cell envelope biogenesis protein TolA [Bradyrhizobium sp. G127]
MIKKFLSKYILEVIPSIVATVVGAYIVTHYINSKPEADKPKAGISAPAETSKDAAPQALKADEAGDKAFKETPKAEAARLKAEKLAAEKAAAERAAVDRAENAKRAAEKLAAEKAAAEKAAAEKLASEKAASDKRDRERTVAKSAPVASPSAEANGGSERDANDLARAAIERLRKSSDPRSSETPRAPEAARAEEPAKPQPERAKVNSVVYAPAAPQPSVQPLPPAVNVAPAPPEVAIITPPAPFPKPVDEARGDDSSRLSPPADIPSRPLDLRAREKDRSVAEGVVSAARSVFEAVLPERN